MKLLVILISVVNHRRSPGIPHRTKPPRPKHILEEQYMVSWNWNSVNDAQRGVGHLA